MRMRIRANNRAWIYLALLFVSSFAINIGHAIPSTASSSSPSKGSFSYIGGKSKDLQGAFSAPSASTVALASSLSPQQSSPLTGSASSSSIAATSFYEPRGDYSGGGYGGGGGGWGGGGGGPSVYQYALHHPQPYYHPAPMYYEDGGFEGVEKGLLGLLGLGGLKGLLGLLGLAKLALPLLGLLLPLLLPLLLLKAAALLALILLIPVPVITTGRKIPTSFEEGKAYLKETVADLISKIPTDVNQIISKIKDSEMLKVKELKYAKSSSANKSSSVNKNR